MNQMTQLPKTQFSGLEFTNIIEDVKNLIQESPEFNPNWDDFLSSNAGRMLTEIYAWITDQLATRIDWISNENFIGTATQRSSIIKLLKLIGYKFTLPSAATVGVTVELSNISTYNYVIKPTYTNGSGSFTTKTLTATDKNGEAKNFEAIIYDIDNKKFLYKEPITLSITDKIIANTATGQSKLIDFYEGQTKTAFFTSSTNQGQVFRITDSPIINNSVSVFLLSTVNSINYEEELIKVENFLDSKAQRNIDSDGIKIPIPYIVTVKDDNSVDIEFAPTVLIASEDRRLPNGSEILVFYRVGGGMSSNISRQSINLQESISINGQDNQISYYNENEGLGGQDAETVEHAVIHAPLKIRTAGKAVTADDYLSILSGFESLLLSMSYGYSNIPSNYYSRYGTYFSPMEVVSFVLLKKPGWETIPTNKYYLSNWGTFNVENRFNGLYYFNNGNFGNEVLLKANPLIASGLYDHNNVGRTFKNYTVLKTSSDWKASLFKEVNGEQIANADLIASLTKTKYNKNIHKKIIEITDHFVYDSSDPYLYGDYEDSGMPRDEITQNINAYYISKIPFNTTTGLNITANKRFDIHVDNRNVVHIDLSDSGTISSPVSLPVVVSTINSQINASYGNGYAYQDFGILIPNRDSPVPGLENDDEQIFKFRISGVNFDVNSGTHQSYHQILARINTAINSAGYLASFVVSHANIVCWDIRIQRTTNTGSVLLTDSNDAHDLLDAFGAAPSADSSFAYSVFANVASIVTNNGYSYLKLTSPNTGTASKILLEKSVVEDCSMSLLGLDYATDGVLSYECFGVKSLTIITRDPTEEDFGDIVYEHGTINFSFNDPEKLYLNYIKESNKIIPLGHYFNTNFESTEPEWKPVDNRIYNSAYVIDDTDISGVKEIFDIDNSNLVLRFNKEETNENSIYKITNDYNLTRATKITLSSTNTIGINFSSLSGSISIKINDDVAATTIPVNNDVSSAESFCSLLNSTFNTRANETLNGNIVFATMVNNIIILTIDNKNGKIVIVNTPVALTIFPIIVGSIEYTVSPNGDYYLELNKLTDSIDMYMVGEGINIPDSPFYINYLTDRRHVFLDTTIEKFHTDEDDLLYFLAPYTMVGIENVFKHPLFLTFDLSAEVFCSSTVSASTIKESIELSLKYKYGISNIGLGTSVNKSEIINIIMNTVGVRYVNVSYFGLDATNTNTNQNNEITCSFDEVIVLSDVLYSDFGLLEHGLNIIYTSI